jgi:hypothetical protein
MIPSPEAKNATEGLNITASIERGDREEVGIHRTLAILMWDAGSYGELVLYAQREMHAKL